jgi:NodT family efflux transporter outer membrane factor (OMF) lipoprotein
MKRLSLILTASLALSGCMVGPNYSRPSAPLSPTFKEAAGWTAAAPADTLDRGDWWTLFDDPVLNGLEARVQVNNQNIIAAEAAYRQARALVSEQRASLFPTVDLTGGATRSGSGGGGGATITNPDGSTTTTGGGGGARTTYRASLGASWEPDVWGRIRRTIEAAKANAQASDADLAAARLAAQGELAVDYFDLRQVDVAAALSQQTVDGYRRTVQILQNQYNAGVVAHADLLQAQTQLANAFSDLAGLHQQRATFEHAIAVLVGEAPGNFSLAAQPTWTPHVPEVPPGVPSTLLQRRPDIAAAERRTQAANAQIGIETAAYFPSISLTGSYGYAASELGSLFRASNSVWSLGASAAETLLDFGARKARVKGARAGYDQAVAQYRQTVLTALQDVEDQLIAAKVLAQQEALRRQASQAADAAEQMVLNRYRAGMVSYTDVVVAQAAAYSARTALVQTTAQRLATNVALIQSLGGGWTTAKLAH